MMMMMMLVLISIAVQIYDKFHLRNSSHNSTELTLQWMFPFGTHSSNCNLLPIDSPSYFITLPHGPHSECCNLLATLCKDNKCGSNLTRGLHHGLFSMDTVGMQQCKYVGIEKLDWQMWAVQMNFTSSSAYFHLIHSCPAGSLTAFVPIVTMISSWGGFLKRSNIQQHRLDSMRQKRWMASVKISFRCAYHVFHVLPLCTIWGFFLQPNNNIVIQTAHLNSFFIGNPRIQSWHLVGVGHRDKCVLVLDFQLLAVWFLSF